MRDARLLRNLPELPFLHLTATPAPVELRLGDQSKRLVEVTRITGALSISVLPEYLGGVSLSSPDDIAKAVEIVRAASDLRDAHSLPPATLTACTIPYHNFSTDFPFPNDHVLNGGCAPVFPCGCTQTGGCVDDPRQTCNDTTEVGIYTSRLSDIIAALPNDVVIAQQFFNCERWARDPFDPCGTWNDAVTAKHDAYFLAGKALLPTAPIHRYERLGIACVGTGAPSYSLIQSPLYTLDEQIDENADIFSVSGYTVPDLDRMRASIAATIAAAQAREDPRLVTSVVVWLALASGFRELGTRVAFDPDWNYGVRFIRDVAKLIRNDKSGLLNVVALYPEPFSRGTPRWLRYFIEFVRAMTS